jgi:hypothetical protein
MLSTVQVLGESTEFIYCGCGCQKTRFGDTTERCFYPIGEKEK